MSGPQVGSGCSGEKNLLPPQRTEPQTIQPVIQSPNVKIAEKKVTDIPLKGMLSWLTSLARYHESKAPALEILG